jgi:hypothetical protein
MATAAFYHKQFLSKILGPMLAPLAPLTACKTNIDGHKEDFTTLFCADYLFGGLGWLLLGCPLIALIRAVTACAIYSISLYVAEVVPLPWPVALIGAIMLLAVMLLYNSGNDTLLAMRISALENAGAVNDVAPSGFIASITQKLVAVVGLISRYVWMILIVVSFFFVGISPHAGFHFPGVGGTGASAPPYFAAAAPQAQMPAATAAPSIYDGCTPPMGGTAVRSQIESNMLCIVADASGAVTLRSNAAATDGQYLLPGHLTRAQMIADMVGAGIAHDLAQKLFDATAPVR